MKLRRTIAAFLIVLIAVFVVFAQWDRPATNDSSLPAPTGMVNDFANIIDDSVQAQIEQKLRDFKVKTNPQVEIAVVTVETTGERPIFDYSLALARGWKIGSKEDDNPSALLLIAVNDRKYYTQVSKDLEDELTDAIVGQLQRQYLVPAFKAGNYTKGVNDTIDAYIRTIEQRASAPSSSATPTQTKSSRGGIGTRTICCLVVIVIILLIIFSSSGRGGGGTGSSRRDRDRWRSGGFGGIAPVIFWGGGGGDSSSSSWGSSSDGGDSWGGFGGGGDFGGGGAGGDW
jgi:uncharacterized protein